MDANEYWMHRRISIGSPDGFDHELWRYMDFLKFVDLLQRRKLWFTRLDQFPDPYEGLLTKPTAEFFAVARSRSGYRGGVNYEKFRKFRCVNCWHINDYESAAMWDLYSKAGGIAIRSRISLLAESFPPTEHIRAWGIRGENVRYLDYEIDITAGETGEGLIAHTPGFFCKRKSFEHEREYRLVISLEKGEAENTGVFVPVLLEQLIEKVVVSPNAPKWVAEVVRKEVAVHNLDVEVVQSDLYSPLLK